VYGFAGVLQPPLNHRARLGSRQPIDRVCPRLEVRGHRGVREAIAGNAVTVFTGGRSMMRSDEHPKMVPHLRS
jgi:hypothetical protein